jgi:hypothetical protein
MLLLDFQPYFLGRAGVSFERAVFDGRCYLHESWHGVIKELFVALAEVVFSILDTRFLMLVSCSIFHAAATADVEVLAEEAFVAEFLFGSCESAFLLVGGEFGQGRFENVAQSPLGLYEEFTTESVARVLDDYKACALPAVRADRVFAHDVVC